MIEDIHTVSLSFFYNILFLFAKTGAYISLSKNIKDGSIASSSYIYGTSWTIRSQTHRK